MVSCFAVMLFGWLRNVCLQLVCMVEWLPGWLVGWFDLMWHFNFHFKVSLPLTTSIGIYLLLNLVFTPEHLWTDSMPTDLQTKVTDAFAHLNTRAPITRKETVGKKSFLIWWNTFMKNSTSSFKLSIDESNCQSYSATVFFPIHLSD